MNSLYGYKISDKGGASSGAMIHAACVGEYGEDIPTACSWYVGCMRWGSPGHNTMMTIYDDIFWSGTFYLDLFSSFIVVVFLYKLIGGGGCQSNKGLYPKE